jgi:hypothetical protein
MNSPEEVVAWAKKIAETLPERFQEIAFSKLLEFGFLRVGIQQGAPGVPQGKSRDTEESSDNGSLIQNLADELGVSPELVNSALAPSLDPPYLHFDPRWWADFKKKLPKRGRGSVSKIAVPLAALCIWQKHAGIEAIDTSMGHAILSTISEIDKNAPRGVQNTSWLQMHSGKIKIKPVEYDKALEVVRAYCEKRAPNFE